MPTHGNKGFTPRLRRQVRTFTCQVPGCVRVQDTGDSLETLRENTFKRYGVRALICFEHFQNGEFDWVALETAILQRDSKFATKD